MMSSTGFVTTTHRTAEWKKVQAALLLELR